MSQSLNVAEAVRDRYSDAAVAAEASLCCPVDYDPQFLKVIPDEIIERDYGCGDPSKHVEPGDTVLDLGSGGGKICYIASQVVGPTGHVIGVDVNSEMLDMARRHQPAVSRRIGHDNVQFRRGKIQDLRLDLEQFDAFLAENPAKSAADWIAAEEHAEKLRRESPMIEDGSIDVVVSNCVLNLVDASDRRSLFSEVFRVLRRGGRAVISDIVCDESVPRHLQDDPRLWSGCISGAFREDEFLHAFEEAGFYGIEILSRQEEPWAVVEGIEFRSITVCAWKGKEGPCLDRRQAVIYNGPWKAVIDDDGHRLERGKRMAVCDKTFSIYTTRPYTDQVTPVPPHALVPMDKAPEFNCLGSPIRDPGETKQGANRLTMLPGEDCCDSSGCC